MSSQLCTAIDLCDGLSCGIVKTTRPLYYQGFHLGFTSSVGFWKSYWIVAEKYSKGWNSSKMFTYL